MGTNSVAFAMYIAIYLLFAIIFILWISSVIYRRCFRRFPARSGAAVGPTIVVFQTGPTQELPRGLDISVIESFPKFAYSRHLGCTSMGTDMDTDTDTNRKTKMKMVGECVVCLAAFEENETLRLVPKCGHVFHADCVDTWLRSNATCPFCRANLLPDGPRFGETTPVQVQVVIDGNRIRG